MTQAWFPFALLALGGLLYLAAGRLGSFVAKRSKSRESRGRVSGSAWHPNVEPREVAEVMEEIPQAILGRHEPLDLGASLDQLSMAAGDIEEALDDLSRIVDEAWAAAGSEGPVGPDEVGDYVARIRRRLHSIRSEVDRIDPRQG